MRLSGKGVIDENLSALMLDFIEKLNASQFKNGSKTNFDTLTSKEIQVISSVGEKKMAMGVLSELTSVKSSTLTKISDGLVKKGYLKRLTSDQDRRIVYVQLTEKGLKVRADILKKRRETINSVLGTLGFEEQVVMLNAMKKLNKIF
ncbi:MAG: MarR family transcriptional regulator [Candidatus Altiarchaeota archaeon]|nr:MarR family transcriptional regulator [Candidatus Altiarchaeota archaeon]